MTDLHTKAQAMTKPETERELVRLWELVKKARLELDAMIAFYEEINPRFRKRPQHRIDIAKGVVESLNSI